MHTHNNRRSKASAQKRPRTPSGHWYTTLPLPDPPSLFQTINRPDRIVNAQAQKHNLTNTPSNYDSILTYNETGYADYTATLAEYALAREKASLHAGRILNSNLQDMTARSGLALAGWRPRRDDMAAQAVEWWNWGMALHSEPDSAQLKLTPVSARSASQLGAVRTSSYPILVITTHLRSEGLTFRI
jgi:hypothetical protein